MLFKDVDPSKCIIPFKMAPVKIMILGVVCSDRQQFALFPIAAGEMSEAEVSRCFLVQHVMPWTSRKYPEGNSNLPSYWTPVTLSDPPNTFWWRTWRLSGVQRSGRRFRQTLTL